jgi:hypothetical protein
MMRTNVAQHHDLTLAEMAEGVMAYLPPGERVDGPRIREMIGAAMLEILPVGIKWDGEIGTLYFDGAPGMGPAVQWANLPALAAIAIDAVSNRMMHVHLNDGDHG